MIRECRDCGESFAVDSFEQEHLVAKKLSLPRRCLPCRAKRRGFEDRTIACARCGDDFLFEAKLAVLVQMFGWAEPARCLVGCDAEARKNLRGERKNLAELKEHADGSVAALEAAEKSKVGEANRPEDLFKGLDAMLEKAAKAEAEAAAEDSAASLFSDKEPEIGGLNPLARPGEEVPSPDSLFRGLSDKRKAKG